MHGQQGDREFRGAIVYGLALGLTAFLAYLFNAILGRRLDEADFATFGALLAGLLALSGPVTALFGGAAMAAARQGTVPRARWRRWVLALAALAAAASLLPVSDQARAFAWFGVAMPMWLLSAWNRGLLTGLGRIGTVGGSIIFEGLARVGLALALLGLGWGVVGASAGLALGITCAFLFTEVLLPARETAASPPLRPEVKASIVGLLFLGVAQFADMIAVRLIGPEGAAPYAAASFLARLALYVQIPAAAYALRKAAMVGPGKAVHRSLLLALGPGLLVTAVLGLFPGHVLDLTYDGRYLTATGLVRVLTAAMFLSGLGLVLVQLLMGAGRTAWVWSMSIAGAIGMVVVFAVAAEPIFASWAMFGVQGAVLAVAVLHVRRLLAAERGAEGAVLILSWRDTRNPQGGGSEVFVEEVARRLAERGREVTVFCAAHENAPREEVMDGIRFMRRGSWRTVYLWAAWYHLTGRFARHEVVVDVQNAVPFFAPLYCGRPVVVLVHHLHQEQWRMIFGPRMARIGWWIESKLAPRVYRRSSYVTVSEATKSDLVGLGVEAERISVVHNGSLPVTAAEAAVAKAPVPTVTYLGRLVPHKRVELLLEAAAALRREVPTLRVRVVGQGPWEEQLRERAIELGLDGIVSFDGFVDEETKHQILAESWVLALPSVKEGWGLAVMEAAAHGTPAVAFAVGGLTESIEHGRTGLLADDQEALTENLRAVLTDEALRERLGSEAKDHAARFSWTATAEAFETALVRGITTDSFIEAPKAIPLAETV